ncbi:ABC transporter ATP-binding protein [Thalassotalea piscium]|uniref:Iron complex transport system ATP-binding protein n=1 Tax=Thalassotalea piscium TaxID=1230533 RepID=A0A7X0TVC2_9GAMM|nr:ABC transporter ATP-binding protein [Thalassotalea piscium]MBB6544980.1 iron complex transport system ATP-binding protein [Thalassotalea piscium]
MSVVLEANNLSWQVGNKVIVEQISFSLKKGETLGIVGPNGAGKTSLLKCLYREYIVEKGEVRLQGKNICEVSRNYIAQKIAVVGQHHDSIFDLTVFDVVHMGLLPHKGLFDRDNSEDLKLIEHALQKVDLHTKAEQVFKTLSGGEQQRCLIARAIVQRSDILIMDEPTNHLDVFYQHQILSLVKKLKLSLVITVHDLNLAAQYCDRLLLMSDGKLKAINTPEKVLTSECLQQVFKLNCVVDTNPFTQAPRITFAGLHHDTEHPHLVTLAGGLNEN